MIPYLVILSLLLYLIIKYDIKNNLKGKETWINFFMVLLIIFAGLRYHIGSDTLVYESWFDEVPSLQDIYRDADLWSQPLWMLLMSIVKTFTNSFIVFQFIVAIIFNTLLFRFLKQTTDKIFTALFFILCVIWWSLSFEVLRESICVVLYLNSLLYLKNRKILMYVLIGIIMMGFHRFSFIIMIITPFIAILKPKISLPLVILLTIPFFFGSSSFVNIVDTISSNIFDGEAAEKMNYYLFYSDEYGAASFNIIGILISIVMMSFVLPIITIIYNQESEDMKFFNRILVLVVLFGLLRTKLIIFYRFFNYVDIILIVCFVNVLYHSKTIQPIMKVGLCMLASLYLYLGCKDFYRPTILEHRAGVNYNCVYIPYKTVFQEPDPIREELLR